MNSLLLVPELFSSEGGIARILRLYLKALCELSKDGESVSLVALNDGSLDSTELRHYSNDRLSAWTACSRSKLAFCRAALQYSHRPARVVCGHMGQLPLAWALSRLRPGLHYYLVAHGIEVWRPFSFLERRALRGARQIWSVSEYTRQQVLLRCRGLESKVSVLPNALDPFLIPPGPAPAATGPATILAISRLSLADNYKGIGHLIAAMPAVRAGIPGARLRIVGRGDGLASLQRIARGLELGTAVSFAGYRSDSELHTEFAECRLFALPSQKEGFGLVYLEAMANGRPCLAARSGGAPEVVTGDTGVLVDYGDVPGIAAAIQGALRREWSTAALVERAQSFSYLRFRERLASMLET